MNEPCSQLDAADSLCDATARLETRVRVAGGKGAGHLGDLIREGLAGMACKSRAWESTAPLAGQRTASKTSLPVLKRSAGVAEHTWYDS